MTPFILFSCGLWQGVEQESGFLIFVTSAPHDFLFKFMAAKGMPDASFQFQRKFLAVNEWISKA
jgi:hypothetical protein